jgi:site-specific recombinase XerD
MRYDTEEQNLRMLDRYLAELNVGDLGAVSPDVINRFLTTRRRSTASSYNNLLGAVRRLFDWLVEQETISDSPVQAKARRRTSRRIPFLFDQESAKRLLKVASGLRDNPRAKMRGQTYRTMFALLYGLGLRVGEVSRLRRHDVDSKRSLLVIRESKFGKSRLVPFGPRIGELLATFMEARHAGCDPATDAALFSFVDGQPIHPNTVSTIFQKLVPQLDLDIPEGVSPPRLHDLRHSFAVGTLLRWYRSGIDPTVRLLQLSTFLGHVSPVSTAEYLTITSELLQEAGKRFERFASPLVRESVQ